MTAILPKMLHADLIIWSFPLYYYGMPSKIKALLDRNLPMNLPYMIENPDGSSSHPSRFDSKQTETILISSCGFHSTANNYDSLLKQFDIMYQGKYTKILCPEGEIFAQPELRGRTDEYLTYAEQAGREYGASRSITAKTQAMLDTLLFPPKVFMQMANANWDIKPADGKERTAEEQLRDEVRRFTLQMVAAYLPSSFDGAEKIIEFYYTDVDTSYQLVMGKDSCEVRDSGFTPYTTRIETPYSVWRDIAQGKYSGQDAMMDGKYKTLGDLRLLMSWNRYFCIGGLASAANHTASDKIPKKTNMVIMIMTWTVLWVLLSVHPMIGGIAGIMAVAGVHFANLNWELTIYDHLTCLFVSAFSLFSLLGLNMRIIIPLSYLCFGLMWLGSCLTTIPLTANYSKNDFNGDEALANPLFLKTNLILTACWGVLYLIIPVWTYFIMDSRLSAAIIFLNTACPALLGIFTVWFQKWYPARVAGG